MFWSKNVDQRIVLMISLIMFWSKTFSINKNYGWTIFWSANWYYFNHIISCLICSIISKPFLADSIFPSTLARIIIKGIPTNPHNDLEMSPNHYQSALEKLWRRSKALTYEAQVYFTNQVYLASAIVKTIL